MSENTQLLILYGVFIGQAFLIPLAALAGILSFVWMLQVKLIFKTPFLEPY